MGESDRYIGNRNYPKRNKFFLGQKGNALFTLFTLNVIFFLVLLLIQVVYYFYQQKPIQFNEEVVQWFTMPASLTRLSERPWVIFTQMFSHIGLMEMIANMFWLWAFGAIMQEVGANKKIIPVYIYGGLTSAIFFIAACYSIPSLKIFLSTTALHSSTASIIAIAVATTTLAPKYKFFRNLNGGIPIWVLLLIYIVIDAAGLAKSNAAFKLAHLGGAIAGYSFAFFLRKGKDTSKWMNDFYDWFIHLFDPNKKNKTPTKEKLFYKANNKQPYTKNAIITQQRVDEILDKINSHGYHLLTDDEKNILKKASEG